MLMAVPAAAAETGKCDAKPFTLAKPSAPAAKVERPKAPPAQVAAVPKKVVAAPKKPLIPGCKDGTKKGG